MDVLFFLKNKYGQLSRKVRHTKAAFGFLCVLLSALILCISSFAVSGFTDKTFASEDAASVSFGQTEPEDVNAFSETVSGEESIVEITESETVSEELLTEEASEVTGPETAESIEVFGEDAAQQSSEAVAERTQDGEELTSEELTSEELQPEELTAEKLSEEEAPSEEVPSEEVPTEDFPTGGLPSEDADTDSYEEETAGEMSSDAEITEGETAGEEAATEETSEDLSEESASEEETELTEKIVGTEMTEEEENELLGLFAPGDGQPSWSGYVQSEEEFEAQMAQFPESYRDKLRAIHAVYPNYKFTADYIEMDFQELVDAQIGKKISAYYSASWKAMYDESYGWYENYNWDTGEWYNSEGMFTYASREVIAHFIDPRNFLETSDIYMFMKQSYSEDQTIDNLRSMLQGSFLAEGYAVNKTDPDDVRLGGDYAAVIMEAAQASGTSPFVLAASILLEHGWWGETPLISGYYEANDGTVYKSYYNFYDIGATGGDSNNVIQNGLEYAKAQGWTSRYSSIVNGAVWSADGYTNNGQDTYYYREFNVINGWSSLWHQYSTGIMTAYCSSALMRDALSANTYAALTFRIPVYQNMPETPSEEPAYNDNLNNYYFTDMQATGLEPEFSMANREYAMTVTGDTTLNVAVPQWAVYESADTFYLSPGENAVELNVRSQTGYLRTYTITVLSSANAVLNVATYVGNHLNISDDYPADGVWGDVNGDGKISASDYIAIKNHIMGTKEITEAAALTAADVNQDGRVSASDYIAVKNYIMSK